MTCDVHLVKQVLGQARNFHIPVEVLILYHTLASSEGEQWRPYRKITTLFLNRKTYEVIWREILEKVERVSTAWSHRDTCITNVKSMLYPSLTFAS